MMFLITAMWGGVGLSDCSCFQNQVGELECLGRSGATEIRITDDDCKNKYCIITYISES